MITIIKLYILIYAITSILCIAEHKCIALETERQPGTSQLDNLVLFLSTIGM